jgi:hypothetical protein
VAGVGVAFTLVLGLGPSGSGRVRGEERAGGASDTADGAVLPPRRLRLTLGAGLAVLTYPVRPGQSFAIGAFGWNAEAAFGLPHDLEVGLRLGLRDRGSPALRADQVARGSDTESFGTGLGTQANPELRLRWRAIRRGRTEAGLEDRVVIPWFGGETSATEVFGPWAAVRVGPVLRMEGGVNGVVTLYSFAGGRVLGPALGTPVRVSAALPWRLYVTAFGTAHLFAATPYTSGRTEITAGAGAGWSGRRCGLGATIEGMDLFAGAVLEGSAERWGVAVGASCGI